MKTEKLWIKRVRELRTQLTEALKDKEGLDLIGLLFTDPAFAEKLPELDEKLPLRDALDKLKVWIEANIPTPRIKASKPPKPFYTGNWIRCCDNCEHSEPHCCRLYSRTMKNMDVKTCRDWQERPNDQAHAPATTKL